MAGLNGIRINGDAPEGSRIAPFIVGRPLSSADLPDILDRVRSIGKAANEYDQFAVSELQRHAQLKGTADDIRYTAEIGKIVGLPPYAKAGNGRDIGTDRAELKQAKQNPALPARAPAAAPSAAAAPVAPATGAAPVTQAPPVSTPTAAAAAATPSQVNGITAQISATGDGTLTAINLRLDSLNPESKIAALINGQNITPQNLPWIQNDIQDLKLRGYQPNDEDRRMVTELQGSLQRRGGPGDIAIGILLGREITNQPLAMNADGTVIGVDTNKANIDAAQKLPTPGVAIDRTQQPAAPAQPAAAAAPATAAPAVAAATTPVVAGGRVYQEGIGTDPRPNTPPPAAAPTAPNVMTLGKAAAGVGIILQEQRQAEGGAPFGLPLPFRIGIIGNTERPEQTQADVLGRFKTELGVSMDKRQLTQFAQANERIRTGVFGGDDAAYKGFLDKMASNPEFANRDFNQLVRSGDLMKAARDFKAGKEPTLGPAPAAAPRVTAPMAGIPIATTAPGAPAAALTGTRSDIADFLPKGTGEARGWTASQINDAAARVQGMVAAGYRLSPADARGIQNLQHVTQHAGSAEQIGATIKLAQAAGLPVLLQGNRGEIVGERHLADNSIKNGANINAALQDSINAKLIAAGMLNPGQQALGAQPPARPGGAAPATATPGGATAHPIPPQGPITSTPLPPVAPAAPAFVGPPSPAIAGTGTEIKPLNDKTMLAQAYMKAMGIETGPLDGREGPLTRKGLEDYAKKFPEGIPAGGLKNMSMDDLLKHMNKQMMENPQLKGGANLSALATGANPSNVKAAQMVLNALGFKGVDGKPLPTDGKASPDVTKANADYLTRIKQPAPAAAPVAPATAPTAVPVAPATPPPLPSDDMRPDMTVKPAAGTPTSAPPVVAQNLGAAIAAAGSSDGYNEADASRMFAAAQAGNAPNLSNAFGAASGLDQQRPVVANEPVYAIDDTSRRNDGGLKMA